MCQSILQRVAAGDASAVDDCLAKFGGLVWSIVRRHCPNHADAEDASQDAFLAIWQGSERFDPTKGSETTFVTTIVRRRLIDRHRKQRRRLEAGSLEYDPEANDRDHTVQAQVAEEAACVKTRMAELRAPERRVIEMAVWEGMSQSQIAEATSLPLGTVKSRTSRGLTRLRKLLGADSQNGRQSACDVGAGQHIAE
jgi:RNA polymerase sigma-70 factor (ECF subfamily)